MYEYIRILTGGALRLAIFLTLPFLFGKSAFSIEQCVQESLKFADCVDATIVAKATTAESRDALTKQVAETCASEKKDYEGCGQFEKSAFSADFVKVRVELFTKENRKAFAGAPAVDPEAN